MGRNEGDEKNEEEKTKNERRGVCIFVVWWCGDIRNAI
jgi:hypothetical protein